MKKVAVIFADGFEEIEGVSIVDVLRRGSVEVDIVGLDKLPIAGAHGVKFVCDMTLYDLEEDEYDMLVLPGGQPGVSNIEGNLKMREIIKRFDKKVNSSPPFAPRRSLLTLQRSLEASLPAILAAKKPYAAEAT